MDDVAFLRKRIESYADYTDVTQRHLADEQIRAYMGEALSRLSERLQPVGAAREATEATLWRCEFADQLVVRGLDALRGDAAELALVYRADRAVVELADRADSIDGSGLTAYVAQVDAALTARADIFIRGGTVPQTTPAPELH